MTGETHLSGLFRCVLGAFLVLTSVSVAAAQAEFHYQYGKLTNPFSSVREYTSILTVQHATSWRLGDSYLFVDILGDGGHDGFNDKNLYGEWYPTLSFSKLGGRSSSWARSAEVPSFSVVPVSPVSLSCLSTGVVAPTTCLTTCMVYPNGRGKLARITAICG